MSTWRSQLEHDKGSGDRNRAEEGNRGWRGRSEFEFEFEFEYGGPCGSHWEEDIREFANGMSRRSTVQAERVATQWFWSWENSEPVWNSRSGCVHAEEAGHRVRGVRAEPRMQQSPWVLFAWTLRAPWPSLWMNPKAQGHRNLIKASISMRLFLMLSPSYLGQKAQNYLNSEWPRLDLTQIWFTALLKQVKVHPGTPHWWLSAYSVPQHGGKSQRMKSHGIHLEGDSALQKILPSIQTVNSVKSRGLFKYLPTHIIGSW